MVVIRHARALEFPTVWPLLASMGHALNEDEARNRFETTVADVNHLLVVAVLDGAPIGYAWAQNYGPHLRTGTSTARLHDLFVDETMRTLGAGRALFAAVRSWARNRGITWLQWQASEAALPFYERLGLTGDLCPDPMHPFFEIEFGDHVL